MTANEFWKGFLEAKGLDRETKYFDCFHFEMSEHWANELLRLVLVGKKKATCSSIQSFEAEGLRLPELGDYNIVTDWAGEPRCIIMTTAVDVLPFNEMTWELCSREGEDDCLESWRAGHIGFFTAEGEALGYKFSEDMTVVLESFEVVYKAEM